LLEYLKNFLPWRRFPLVGEWKVDLETTEQRLIEQLPIRSRVEPTLLSLSAQNWEFTRSKSIVKRRNPNGVGWAIQSSRLYRWALGEDQSVFFSELLEDGCEVRSKIHVLDANRFEFFDVSHGHSVVWRGETITWPSVEPHKVRVKKARPLVVGKWKQPINFLLQLGDDFASRSYESFGDKDDGRVEQITSSMPEFQFEVRINWLLNGTWVIWVEAERGYLFGRVFKSMYKIIEITADGLQEDGSIHTRIESLEMRRARRNQYDGGNDS